MTERLGPKLPEQPSELSLFPISRDVKLRSLAIIAQDPEEAATRESLTMERDNPFFQAVLFRYFTNVSNARMPVGGLVEGSVWAHSILHSQAESINEPLPYISAALWTSYLASRLETKTKAKEAGFTPASFMKKEIEEITTADSAFGEAMTEITKYRIRRNSIYFGAIETYLCLKAAWETKKLEEQYEME